MRTATWLAALTLTAAACSDGSPPASAAPQLLNVEFTEVFRIGDDASERQFADISSMAFASRDRLVVVDADAFTVVVLDARGQELTSFGGRGDGPGEFSRPPGDVAVSGRTVAIDTNSGRIDVFDIAGEVIGTHRLEGRGATSLAFDSRGGVLFKSRAGSIMSAEDAPHEVLRLASHEVIWTSKPLATIRSLQVLAPTAVLAGISAGRIVVGTGDEYDLDVLDASNGRRSGRIARDVPLRAPTEAFVRQFKERLDPARFGGVIDIEALTFPPTFPVTNQVFPGPPGGAVWVFRHWGVGDVLAPPVSALQDGDVRLYDLFSPDSYGYIGTVRVPDRFNVMAGSVDGIAGVVTSELGVQSVVVMRVAGWQ